MMLVALVVDEVEVDPPTEVPLDGAASDSATRVDEEVVPLAAVVTLDDALPVARSACRRRRRRTLISRRRTRS